MDFLTVLIREGESFRHEINREVVRIGRSSANDLVLEEPQVSREHAEISRDADGGYLLADLKSRNGTFLNGRQVTESARLQTGDRIRLGDTVLVFNASVPTSVEFSDQPVSDGSETTLVHARELRSPESEKLALWLDSAPVQLAPARGLRASEIVSAVNNELFSHRPLGEILEKVMDLAQQAVKFERGFLILLKNGEPVVESRRLPRGAGTGTVEISRSVLDRVLRGHESILTRDALADGGLGVSGGGRSQHIRSVMCVPLATNDEMLGVIYVDSRRETGFFGERDLRLLSFLANLVAIKLDQARLFQKAVESERIRQEIWEAARIQARLLPSAAPSIPGYLLDGRTFPCHEVGGDSYDYLAMPDGRHGIALADVTGKGLPAAMLLSSFQLGLRSLCGFDLPLDDVLGRLNRLLMASIPDNCYVALFLGVLDPASQTLTYVNAGHGPPLLFRRGSMIERLEIAAFPLGCFPRDSFQLRTVELRPGDCLVCYSDGITEAQDAEEQMFGEERLIDLVRKAAERPPAEKIADVIAAVKSHCPGSRPQDDVTLVILERQAGS